MNGLLVDINFCTGCHSCEVACKNEHDLPLDNYGIKISKVGPFKIEQQDWVFNYVPSLTKECDLCHERVERGEKPSCVLHCLGQALEYGPVEHLVKRMEEIGSSAQIMIP